MATKGMQMLSRSFAALPQPTEEDDAGMWLRSASGSSSHSPCTVQWGFKWCNLEERPTMDVSNQLARMDQFQRHHGSMQDHQSVSIPRALPDNTPKLVSPLLHCSSD